MSAEANSGDVQGRDVITATTWLYDNFYIVIQRDEKTEQPLDGELAELTSKHFGNIGLFDAEQDGGLGLFQAAAFQNPVDFEHELGLDQMFFRVRNTEVSEHISTSGFVSLLLHVLLSLAISSAWRSLW